MSATITTYHSDHLSCEDLDQVRGSGIDIEDVVIRKQTNEGKREVGDADRDMSFLFFHEMFIRAFSIEEGSGAKAPLF